jgi:hypothetical protein
MTLQDSSVTDLQVFCFSRISQYFGLNPSSQYRDVGAGCGDANPG